jgi:alkaline phosphatase D
MWTGDSWDGYPTERNELLRFIERRAIPNVVSLTADHHMHFSALLWTDYDGPAQPVGAEFGVTALSSVSGFRGFLAVSRRDPELRALTTFDDPRFGPRVEVLNLTFVDGAAAARALTSGSEIDVVLRLADPDHNRHLRYVDSNANGYGLASVDGERLRVDLVTVPAPLEDAGSEGSPIVRHARFELPSATEVGAAQLAGPRFEGRPPFPWDGIRRQR